MQQGLVCFLVVFGGFSVVQSQCVCNTTTQKDVFEKSDLVAQVRFNELSVSENNTWLVYNATFLDVFKPKNSSISNGLIVANAKAKNCNPINFIHLTSEYLVAAKQNGKNYEIKECVGFPQHAQGRPIIAQPWDLVTNKTLTNLRKGKF